ncbi:MAG TPA: adenylate/guanylate cyclase domain-containing protein [Myxococcota bacterium]|nr:adenylate/guanylate cyclase domain-containing protein [Myxococcota bacterium]HRY93969.1 adenylate/guanylate cyclase domain-containing protein [Myxococcota bacterium]HSA23707.1 adenylate/guanylate cyclase domain-containing protein [Myxococcota bacterium]
MRSENLTLVFVDIAGFTERTSRQSRAESEAWLRRYEELLLPLVRAFGGRRVKTIGDAYLCTFASPTDALHFGMAAQDRLFEHNLTAPEAERIVVRVAVNAGEVRVQRGDVFGEPVNIAARVEGVAPAGEIWFTEAVYLAMTKSEVPAEEVGLRSLKGVPEPVRLYRVPPSEDYRLSARGAGAAPAVREPGLALTYPFGGLGLGRLEGRDRGWAALARAQGTCARLWGRVRDGLGDLAGRARALPRRAWLGLAGLLAAACLVLALVHALPASGPGAADPAEQPARTADARVPQAHRLLAEQPPRVTEAEALLLAALDADPALLAEAQVQADLVRCLDRQKPARVLELLVGGLGDEAVPRLLEATTAPRYYQRWNAVRALERLGRLGEVDQAAVYLVDLERSEDCATRKRAARKLAELRDPRALEPLRRARERPFYENLCMAGALEEAIRALEEPGSP